MANIAVQACHLHFPSFSSFLSTTKSSCHLFLHFIITPWKHQCHLVSFPNTLSAKTFSYGSPTYDVDGRYPVATCRHVLHDGPVFLQNTRKSCHPCKFYSPHQHVIFLCYLDLPHLLLEVGLPYIYHR